MVTGPDLSRRAAIEGVVLGDSGDLIWIDLGLDGLGVMSFESSGALARNHVVRGYLAGSDSEGLHLVTQSLRNGGDPWQHLESAFRQREVVAGRVTGVNRGGFSVDVGLPAFLPASRSGARDDAEMNELVGREILCRIVELSPADHDVVLDRRSILELADWWGEQLALQELKAGSIVTGVVCTLTDFGAFVDLGNIDGLLHVRDISWGHVEHPSDVLSVGQTVKVRIERVDAKLGRVALSMKALQPDPWAGVGAKYNVGDRLLGKVTTVTDFGAFVEVEPGVEGLVHESDLSWARRTANPRDIVRTGDPIEVAVLSIDAAARRMSLGRKQATEDPWKDLGQRFPAGSVVTGRVTTLTEFGAFIELAEDIEGLLRVSDISDEYTSEPRDVLTEGLFVRVRVLEVDEQRRRICLSMRDVLQTPPATNSNPIAAGLLPRTTDFAGYSRSVFVNWPADDVSIPIRDAVLFGIVAAEMTPRVPDASESIAGLIQDIRESQFGVHEAGRLAELGFFLGCTEYGSDLHRVKESLVVGAEPAVILGQPVKSHDNDPVQACRLVWEWLLRMKGAVGTAHVDDAAQLYQSFLADVPELLHQGRPRTARARAAEFVSVAREWLGARYSHARPGGAERDARVRRRKTEPAGGTRHR